VPGFTDIFCPFTLTSWCTFTPDSENFADEGRINPVSWWAYFEGGGLAITERGEQQFVWVDLAYF